MVVWDGAFETVPSGGNKPSLGPSVIRATKQGVRERFSKEHTQDLASGLEAEDGFHRQGSAVSYFQSAAPTLRPDGITALDSNDNGRLWVDSDTHELFIFKYPDWVSPFTVIDTLLTGAEAEINTALTGTASQYQLNVGTALGSTVNLPSFPAGTVRDMIIYGKKNGTTQTVKFEVPAGVTFAIGIVDFAQNSAGTLVASTRYIMTGNVPSVAGPGTLFSLSITANYYFAVRFLLVSLT